MRRALLAIVALVCGGLAVAQLAAPATRAQPAATATRDALTRGRTLFVDGCASCHGLDARGIDGQGPSLRGVGAQAADFYVRTGRMPLDHPGDEPVRSKPAYPPRDVDAIVAYVGTLGGPAVPRVDVGSASVRQGRAAFTEHCAGCHQIVARGGIGPGFIAPPLQEASATQVVEAMRIGPWQMPRFSRRRIDAPTAAAIARFVLSTRHPDNAGGWGIGNLGPIPEGMVAWLVGMVALIAVARLIGERAA